jgi:lipoyl(octanoyl) transferase
MPTVAVQKLGLISYQEAWDIQESLFKERIHSKLHPESPPVSNQLLICEHPPVYTIGKSGSISHLLLNEQSLEKERVEFFRINRGGDITFHGPGQLVVYPILDLEEFFTDLKKYMRYLEEVVIQLLSDYMIKGDRLMGATGVWLNAEDPIRARKICAMGVRTSRWVTMHGLALNVNTNLNYFKNIIPCGIADKGVTSIQNETGIHFSLDKVTDNLISKFADVFSCEISLDTTAIQRNFTS